MKRYIRVSDLGQILQVTSTPFDMARHLDNGQMNFEVSDNDDVFDGYFDLETLEVKKLPAQASIHHTFNYTTKQWEDPRTLQDLKTAKWAEMRTTRDAMEATSFPYRGKQIQSDIVSVLRINTAVKAADYAQAQGVPFSTAWRCADDTLLALDGPGLQMMPLALAAYSQALHTQANTLRAQIESAATAQEIAAVAWPAN